MCRSKSTYLHKTKSVVEPGLTIPVDLTCHVDICTAKCDSLTKFYSHLKGHIKEGRIVACPFQQCDKSFTVISTFSHLTRKHRASGEGNLIESITVSAGVVELVALMMIMICSVTCGWMLLLQMSNLRFAEKTLALLSKTKHKVATSSLHYSENHQTCSQYMTSASYNYFLNCMKSCMYL